MLKQLLEKFIKHGGADGDESKIKPVALQIIGLLTEDETQVTDEDWSAIADQDMRKSMIVTFVGLASNEKLMKIMEEVG